MPPAWGSPPRQPAPDRDLSGEDRQQRAELDVRLGKLGGGIGVAHDADARVAAGDRAGQQNITLLPRTMVGSTLGLVLVGVALTAFAGPLFRVSGQSAEEMLNRSSYIQAVLGDEAPVPAIAQPVPQEGAK